MPVLKQGATSMTWVTCRSERVLDEATGRLTKTVSVSSNPFGTLRIQPWLEQRTLLSASPAGYTANAPTGHASWTFSGNPGDAAGMTVQLVLE